MCTVHKHAPENNQTNDLIARVRSPMPVVPEDRVYSLLWLHAYHPIKQ